MNARDSGRLTEAQRVALRLFMQRRTAKQIALELGITPKAVELRLKGAREALGVSTSAEAARWLAENEPPAPYRETLGGSTEVADPAPPLSLPPNASESGSTDPARNQTLLSEARMALAYQPGRLQAGLGWPLPQEGDDRNDLTLAQRLLWPFLAMCGIGVSIGTLVICGSLLSLAGVAIVRLFH